MMFRKFIFFLLVCIFYSQSTTATHIVGGELSYRCLDSNRFELSLTIYRDCFFGDPNAWFDDPASIGVFDGNTDTLVTSLGSGGQVLIPLIGNDTLDPSLSDPCLIASPNVCVHTTTYTDTVTLPFREGGYTLAYQRCCRNETLQNIVDPLASGATYLVRVTERALELGNSSPEFRDWPPIYICTDRPIDFDHSAVDSDGDSLVYTLCTPLLGANQLTPRPQPPFNPPYDNVVWVDPPYNLNNLLGGVPLNIDSETGFMTGIPNTPGQFVVGVCVEEYRNDTLIGTLRRDFQYNVGLCGETTSAFTAPVTTCADHTIQLVNESEFADAYKWIFGNIEEPDSTSVEEEPMVRYDVAGSYDITLIAFNEETGCSDTTSEIITIRSFLIGAEIEWEVLSCTDRFELQLDLTYGDSIPGDSVRYYDWTVEYDTFVLTSFDSVPIIEISSADSVFISVCVESAGGCKAEISDTIFLEFIPDVPIPDTLLLCPGDSVYLNPDAPLDSALHYTWSPGGSLDDPEATNPLAYPQTNTQYSVQITNHLGCTVSDSVYVMMLPDLPPFTIQSSQTEVDPGEPFTLSIPDDPLFANITWQPGQYTDPDSGNTVTAVIEETTTFYAMVTDSSGCSRTDSITIQVIQCPLADTISVGLSVNLCLVGQGYDEQVMEVRGFIPVPEGYEACGFQLEDVQGGYFVIDDHHVNPINGFIKFHAWFHITDAGLIENNDNRILAKLVLCTEEGVECPVPLSIRIFMGTAGMCNMEGFMCGNVLVDQKVESSFGWKSASLEFYFPFLTKYSPDTCEMTSYQAEIWIRYEHKQPELYNYYTFDAPLDTDHIIWNETVTVCQEGAKELLVKFWNNCGDTCVIDPIAFDLRMRSLEDGIHEDTSAEGIHVIPNPANTVLSFTTGQTKGPFSLRIMDSEGRTIETGHRNGGQNEYILNISSLRPGLYFLMVRDASGWEVDRFVKQ